jgi:hypothetical protein
MPVRAVARAAEVARILCPSCLHLAPIAEVVVEGEVVSFQCESCEARHPIGAVSRGTPPRMRLVDPGRAASPSASWVQSRASEFELDVPDDSVDVAVPPTHCPKCVAPRVGKTCAQCGLDFEHGQPDALPGWLVTEWARMVKDWNWIERHLRLVDRAAKLDALWAVARLYRLWLVRHPGDQIAQQVCQEVVSRATTVLVPAASVEAANEARKRRRTMAFAVLFAFLIVVTLTTLVPR